MCKPAASQEKKDTLPTGTLGMENMSMYIKI